MLRVIRAGIFILSNIINSICIAIIFDHLGSTIPVLVPYTTYVFAYTIGARTTFLIRVFLIGCYWCCLRLVAPKQAGSSISEWVSKLQAHSGALNPNHEKMSRARRTFFATTGVISTFNGLQCGFRSWQGPDFADQLMLAAIFLFVAALSIQIACIPIEKGTRGENTTVVNNDGQPEQNEVTPVCEHKDDDNTTQ